MQELRCIFCGTANDRVVIYENGFKGRKCATCGLIYISPRPSAEEVAKLYRDDKACLAAECHVSNEFSKRLEARHHLKLMRLFVEKGSLLEVGAGAGFFLDEARRVGFHPYGLEFNPIQAAFIRDRLAIPCEQGSLDASKTFGRNFDVVYHCDVISHLFDPVSEFRKLHKMMTRSSFLVFETGNLGEVNLKYFKYFKRFQYPDHLFFFTTQNLVDLLDRSGFECVSIARYSILAQLVLGKIIRSTKLAANRFVSETKRKLKSSEKNQPCSQSESPSHMSIVGKALRKARSYIDYLLRYKIGKIAPKSGRPQTVIVIAKRRDTPPLTLGNSALRAVSQPDSLKCMGSADFEVRNV